MANLSASDWEKRYATEDTPWDLKGPTPEFMRLAEESFFPRKGGRALVPGGGRGHDAIFLAQKGFEVNLVDFAPSALEAALAEASREKVVVNAFRQDFFELSQSGYHQNSYDLFLEYTFFCAIDPSLRADYARAAASLLRPGGILLGLFFPLLTDKAGPPFQVSQEEIEKLFSPHFELRFEDPRESIKPRAGREIVGIFRKV